MHRLILADGQQWRIRGGNPSGRQLADSLAGAMSLISPESFSSPILDDPSAAISWTMVITGHRAPRLWKRLPMAKNGIVRCHVGPVGNDELLMAHLLDIGQLIASFSERQGGLLLHAALARQGEQGIILLGGSGRGKTTASLRIPAPWHSCCDDYTLVVRDGHGGFQAHPWPTWSRFAKGGPGGAWQVMRSVPLRGMFFLQPAPKDTWEPKSPSETVVRIMEAAEQANWPVTMGLQKGQRRSVRLRRLDNAFALARKVPFFNLHLTLKGKFWLNIAEALHSR
jgi:SynChlorMet cassette protein ScmC